MNRLEFSKSDGHQRILKSKEFLDGEVMKFHTDYLSEHVIQDIIKNNSLLI